MTPNRLTNLYTFLYRQPDHPKEAFIIRINWMQWAYAGWLVQFTVYKRTTHAVDRQMIAYFTESDNEGVVGQWRQKL